METAQQNEPVSEYAAPNKILQAPCTKYLTHPQSPDSYTGDNLVDADQDVNKMGAVIPTKWEHSDDDLYSSRCPKDKKYSCKRPPSNSDEEKFLRHFRKPLMPSQLGKCLK